MSNESLTEKTKIDFKKFKGVVFGFPKEKNISFSLEFARFLVIGNEAGLLVDKELDTYSDAVKASNIGRYFSYVGDCDEVFEFYLLSRLSGELSALGLTLQYGEINKWSKLEDEDGGKKNTEWNQAIREYLNYVKENYILCTQEFLDEGKYSEVYNEYSDGLLEISNAREKERFDDGEEEKRIMELQERMEKMLEK
jgi:hypothetical protein